jgi:ribosome-associated protein
MDEPVSKSEQKRQAAHLRDLGKKLTTVSTRTLERLHLSEDILRALEEYHRINSNEAKRRHLSYLGRLLRETQTEELEALLNEMDESSSANRYQFHQLETWRERLLSDGKALTEYISDNPHVDRQALRTLIAKARKDESKSGSRALFRFLRKQSEAAE